MTAMSLQSMTDGRFMLGLGTSGPQVVEGWHGVPFAGAVSRMRETTEIVRMICNGERVVYEGQHYTLALPGGQGQSAPLWVTSGRAAAGLLRLVGTEQPANLRRRRRWLARHLLHSRDRRRLLRRHSRGAESVGRNFDEIDLDAAAGVEFTDDVEAAAARHARGIAFTLGAMGSATTNFYNDAFCRQGWADAAKEVQRLWIEGAPRARARACPVELAHKVNLLGNDAEILDRLRVYRDAGVNTIRAGIAGDSVHERIENSSGSWASSISSTPRHDLFVARLTLGHKNPAVGGHAVQRGD